MSLDNDAYTAAARRALDRLDAIIDAHEARYTTPAEYRPVLTRAQGKLIAFGFGVSGFMIGVLVGAALWAGPAPSAQTLRRVVDVAPYTPGE